MRAHVGMAIRTCMAVAGRRRPRKPRLVSRAQLPVARRGLPVAKSQVTSSQVTSNQVTSHKEQKAAVCYGNPGPQNTVAVATNPLEDDPHAH